MTHQDEHTLWRQFLDSKRDVPVKSPIRDLITVTRPPLNVDGDFVADIPSYTVGVFRLFFCSQVNFCDRGFVCRVCSDGEISGTWQKWFEEVLVVLAKTTGNLKLELLPKQLLNTHWLSKWKERSLLRGRRGVIFNGCINEFVMCRCVATLDNLILIDCATE